MNQNGQRSVGERIGNDYGWLMGQFVLFSLMAVGAPGGRWVLGRLPAPWPWMADVLVGIALMLGGLLVANQARTDLGDSLRVAPSPLEDAELVERGWYGRVRHPLYLAVLLGVVGWAVVWMSLPGFLLAGAITGFFALKTRHEECLLRQRYADYECYMKRVRSRFVPGVL